MALHGTREMFPVFTSRLWNLSCSRLLQVLPYSTSKHNSEIIYYDLETTGLNPRNKHKGVEILEIGAISEKETFQQYILPTKPIPVEATNVHGLFIKEKGGIGELHIGVHRLADVSKIVRPVLEREFRTREWRLGFAVDRLLKREQSMAHGALSDVQDTRDLLLKIANMKDMSEKDALFGNRYAWKEFEDVWVVCFDMTNSNDEKVKPELGMRELVSLQGKSEIGNTRKTNEYQSRADEQEFMLDDSFYDGLNSFSGNNICVNEDVWGLEGSNTDVDTDNTVEGEEIDFSEDARLMLETIKFAGSKVGLSFSCLIVIGSSSTRIWPKLKRSQFYGKGKTKPMDYWMALGKALFSNKYLDEIHNTRLQQYIYSGYKVNSRGRMFLSDKNSVLKMKPTYELRRICDQGQGVIQVEEVESSQGSLGNWKSDHSAKDNIPEVSGDFVNVPEDFEESAAVANLIYSVRQTYGMYQENKDIEEVARLRGLKTSTLMTHLATAMEQGAPVDIADFNITDSLVENVARVIRKPPISSDVSRMKPIKIELDLIECDADYDQIKLIVAKLKLEHGINEDRVLQWS